MLGAIKSSKRFEKLPGEDIIRLNNDAQLLRVGDAIFVLNLKILERNMGFSALIQRAATETIDAIEDLDIIDDCVVLECRKLLTDSNIERIAASVSEVCESNRDTVSIKRIKATIQEADAAIENLWKVLERGQVDDMITERI